MALDLRKTQKLPQIVSDGKRSLSIIHVHCRLCIKLVNVEPYTVNSASFFPDTNAVYKNTGIH
jgi:hypothetical protein